MVKGKTEEDKTEKETKSYVNYWIQFPLLFNQITQIFWF